MNIRVWRRTQEKINAMISYPQGYRRSFRTAALPAETLEAIRNAKMDLRDNHLDDLVKDCNP